MCWKARSPHRSMTSVPLGHSNVHRSPATAHSSCPSVCTLAGSTAISRRRLVCPRPSRTPQWRLESLVATLGAFKGGSGHSARTRSHWLREMSPMDACQSSVSGTHHNSRIARFPPPRDRRGFRQREGNRSGLGKAVAEWRCVRRRVSSFQDSGKVWRPCCPEPFLLR